MTFIINVWGARGRWFESSHPDIIESIDNLMIVDAFCFIYKRKCRDVFRIRRGI